MKMQPEQSFKSIHLVNSDCVVLHSGCGFNILTRTRSVPPTVHTAQTVRTVQSQPMGLRADAFLVDTRSSIIFRMFGKSRDATQGGRSNHKQLSIAVPTKLCWKP
jgi:hypothetical protein